MTTTRNTHSGATWRTIDIVVAAVVAVAFGVVFVAWNALWTASTPLFVALPPAQALLYGVWLLPGVLVGLIVRRPGAALFGGIVSASVSALIGSQWGLDTLFSGAIQGGGAELAFAIGLYRTWNLPLAMLAGALSGVGAAIHDLFIVAYYPETGPDFWAVFAAATVVSGIVIGGIGAWLLLRALVASGVLADFAAGREQREV
ncbi:MAG TPA: ECF transporter S component [Candidatus Limnocylindria bacterium]|nr:ECF transporter S component [Candidatus Limnocylindria bacterium]